MGGLHQKKLENLLKIHLKTQKFKPSFTICKVIQWTTLDSLSG